MFLSQPHEEETSIAPVPQRGTLRPGKPHPGKWLAWASKPGPACTSSMLRGYRVTPARPWGSRQLSQEGVARKPSSPGEGSWAAYPEASPPQPEAATLSQIRRKLRVCKNVRDKPALHLRLLLSRRLPGLPVPLPLGTSHGARAGVDRAQTTEAPPTSEESRAVHGGKVSPWLCACFPKWPRGCYLLAVRCSYASREVSFLLQLGHQPAPGSHFPSGARLPHQ